MPTRNINLSEHFDQFVEEQLESGLFLNASEVLRAGLRLLEQQTREEQEKLQLLKSLASEAFDQIDQGQGISIKNPKQLASVIARIGRRAATSANRHARGS